MGVVYQASDPQIDRMVAVKVLHQSRSEDEYVTKRFLKEAMVIGRLSHPNIVAIFDVGEENGTVYLAMELLEGMSLTEVIQKNAPDIETVVAFGIQIAEALDYAHQKGVVHRDIKPDNIFVLPDGRIKINDFGIAHIDDSTATMQTQMGDILGTPAYMSPEQVLGKGVDGRADLFSLGAVLYEMSTGRRPFGGDRKGLATLFNEIINTTPPEPMVASAAIPAQLSAIIMKALEKEPENRFKSGNDFAEALKACFSEDEPVVEEELLKPQVEKKSHSGLVAAVFLAIMAVGGGAAYYFLHSETPAGKISISPVQPARVPVKTAAPAATTGGQSVIVQQLPKIEPSAVPPAAGGKDVRTVPVGAVTPVATPAAISPKLPAVTNSATKGSEPAVASEAPKQLPKFAFLKVTTTPKGAQVYVDGTLKGTTPLHLKHDFGSVRIKITHAGYKDVERNIVLEKMRDYPVKEKLIPLK